LGKILFWERRKFGKITPCKIFKKKDGNSYEIDIKFRGLQELQSFYLEIEKRSISQKDIL